MAVEPKTIDEQELAEDREDREVDNRFSQDDDDHAGRSCRPQVAATVVANNAPGDPAWLRAR